ncbi:hypothetical protein [Streptomyces sp. NPDC049879]|uniref:hypothetical protein n=1 Tax=Streptomyces sp. NPDC049879 TaxID=3365598 RepID=UPI0037A1E2A0
MFWCPTCKCAYPHGPEGPAVALEAHTEARHDGDRSPEGGVRPITGRQVVIAFVALVVLAWAARAFGFGQ